MPDNYDYRSQEEAGRLDNVTSLRWPAFFAIHAESRKFSGHRFISTSPLMEKTG